MLLLVLLALQGCIGDDVTDCHYDDGVRLYFPYTPGVSGEKGPAADGVSRLRLMIFNEDDTFRDLYTDLNYQDTGDTLLITTHLEPGACRLLLFADNGTDFYSLQTDAPTLQQVTARLARNAENDSVEHYPLALYHAYVDTLLVPDNGIVEHRQPLLKLNNEINVNVTGLDTDIYDPQSVNIHLALADGDYLWNAALTDSIAPLLTYPPQYADPLEDGRSATFHTLKLADGMSAEFQVTARRLDNGAEETLYRTDLIALLRLYLDAYGAKSFNQMHEYKIDVDFQSTGFLIYVNDWLLITSDQGIE